MQYAKLFLLVHDSSELLAGARTVLGLYAYHCNSRHDTLTLGAHDVIASVKRLAADV